MDVIEEEAIEFEGRKLPLDTSRENPNGIEFDNLYLDMNGIIHPCSHPEQGPQPKTEEEMYEQLPYLGKHDIKRLLRNEP